MKPLPIKTSYSSLGYADFNYDLVAPIDVKQHKMKLKIIGGVLTKSIPNVFAYGDWDNTIIYVSNDNWVSETKIDLFRGNYSVTSISNAINAQIGATYYTNIADPAFYMRVNSSLDRVYFVIDDTKMKVAGSTFGIDFSRSDICKTLGFSAVKKWTGSQTVTCDVNPEVDHFGSTISVFVDGIGDNISILNGRKSTYLTSINLNSDSSASLYTIPDSGDTMIDVTNPVYQIRNISVRFVGSRNDRRVVVFDGESLISLGISLE